MIKKRILIIEDDDLLRQIYHKKLALEGFKLNHSSSGIGGLQLAKYFRPDLIILDIMLPGGVNGFDVLEALKKDPKTSATPVIVLTNLDSEKKTAMEIGAAEYIVKSEVSIDKVVKTIKRHVDEKSK